MADALPMRTLNFENNTVVCQHPYEYSSGHVWRLENPLMTNTPLLLVQLSLIALTSQLLHFCLKPLGQSIIVAQILSGIMFGPSVLGHQKTLKRILFPNKGILVMETTASFGLMFFFFVIGVKANATSMFKLERKARIIATTLLVVSFSIPIALVVILKKYVTMDKALANALPVIALSQSYCSFAVIACLLSELKIQNTEVGKLSLNIAGLFDPAGIIISAVFFSMSGKNSGGNHLAAILQLSSTIAVLGSIVLIMRPIILWIFEHTKKRDSVNEICILTLFVFVLLSGLGTEIVGQHCIMGPLVLGLVTPNKPPLGAALVAKLETLMFQIFYPTFLAVNGLQTNLNQLEFQASWIVGLIVVVAFLVKVAGVMVPAYYMDVKTKDSFVVGLALNGKGIVELAVCSFWKHAEIISEREFSLSVMSVVLITALISPLVKFLHRPSDRYFSMRRCTIEHSKHDAEVRIMVCIHTVDNVPTAINLLEASHASEESRLAVLVLMLEELVGRDKPILVAHQTHRVLQGKDSSSTTHILKAIEQYELHNQGHADVQCFTSVSKYETMRDDICLLAMDWRSAIIILPFHKKWAIDGTVDSVSPGIQAMNIKVLKSAPCSVGILIDRGVLNQSKSLLTTRAKYRIAVLYIGGADDAEALAYGARMAKHLHVEVTVVLYLLFGDENSTVRKHNSDLLQEYRQANAGNGRFLIREEVLKDGVGLTSSIRKMTDRFKLIIVGRKHTESSIFEGLEQWSEYPELGVVGDMLASEDIGIKASVLVVQQQKIRGKLVNHMAHRAPNDKNQLYHDTSFDEGSKGSWTITVDR